MRVLTVDEIREVIASHPELRMHMIPMNDGLLIDDSILLIPTAEGELQAVDISGIEEIFYA